MLDRPLMACGRLAKLVYALEKRIANLSYETLLVCLGAQKSGTTWLWRYVREHPQCATPALKELHFFDGKYQHLAKLLERTEEGIAGASTSDERTHLQEKRAFIQRFAALASRPSRTVEDFEALLATVATPETKVLVEFTPAKGMLGQGRLRDLAALPIAPKFVMILRDPVGRMRSQIRMVAKKAQTDPNAIRAAAMDLVDRFVAGEEHVISNRHDYAGMLRRVRNAIPADRLHIDSLRDLHEPGRHRSVLRLSGN